MAKKLTPKELRKKAQAMLKQAKEEEDKRHAKIGRILAKMFMSNDAFLSTDFVTVRDEIEKVKNQIQKIMGE